MEAENSQPLLKGRLDSSHILKATLRIPFRNFNFFIFTFLASLPLFFFMFMYEMLFQEVLLEASELREPPPYSHIPEYWPIPFFVTDRLTKEFSVELVHLALLYLVPLHLSEFFAMAVTVHLASEAYTGVAPMTLQERIFNKTRWVGSLITSLYVLALSTCTLLGLVWLVIVYFCIGRHYFYGYFFVSFYLVSIVVLLKKYLEWSAVWNMAVVVSILDGVHRTQALALSDYISRGTEHRGFVLMLVFFAWGLGLRLSCLYFVCYERSTGVITQVCLLGVGNAMKWVVCMVYYYDCRSRILIKTADEETGEAESGDAEASAVI